MSTTLPLHAQLAKSSKDSTLQLCSTIFPRIENLANSPRPRGARKLKGEQNLWRIRVGDYRVIYGVDDRTQQVDNYRRTTSKRRVSVAVKML